MSHNVIECIFQGEKQTRLYMIFLCVLLLRNEVYVFQSDWPHVHINFPLAHHRLHLEISIVVVKRQTMFRTELHQCFDTFSRTLFVGDRDRIDDILLRTWLTMPAWAVAGTDSVLITRKADQLAEPCDLRAVSAVECPIPPTCPECQPWLRECHNVTPAINTVDGFNPADFVRTTVGEEGENDLYLDVKYRLLWFRLHHPNGKIDPELIRVDEKNAIVCCRIYADKADPADQFIGKAYSQRFSTEDRFGNRFLEIAETVAKGRALADAGYGTQFCMNGEALASIIADAPIKMPPDEDAGHPGSVVASFTAQPTADPPVFSQTATAPKSTQPAQQQVQPPVQQSHAPAPEPPKTLDEYLRVMTIEQAKAVKVDFGRFSGWSLGEIAMKSPGDLAWYVKNYSGHNLALKAGATKLLETVGQMAS